MSAYISTQSISASLRQSVLKMQNELAVSQTEFATGNHADIGLALGAGTGQSVSLQAESSLLKAIADANSVASNRLSQTQGHLDSLRSSAQTLLNALIAGNGATSGAAAIQASGASNLQSLTAALNSTLNGDHLFAGVNTQSAPITDYSGPLAPNKQAVDTAFLTAFGMPQTSGAVSSISDSAMQSFLDTNFAPLFQGTNWTSNWSSASNQTQQTTIGPNQAASTSVSANDPAFHELAQAYAMLTDLGLQNLNQGAYKAVVSTATKVLTSAIADLTNLQAGVGIVQSAVSNAGNQMSLQMNVLSTQIGNLESVSTYEAGTRVSELQTQIETSYSLTSQLQQLSLVKFL